MFTYSICYWEVYKYLSEEGGFFGTSLQGKFYTGRICQNSYAKFFLFVLLFLASLFYMWRCFGEVYWGQLSSWFFRGEILHGGIFREILTSHCGWDSGKMFNGGEISGVIWNTIRNEIKNNFFLNWKWWAILNLKTNWNYSV